MANGSGPTNGHTFSDETVGNPLGLDREGLRRFEQVVANVYSMRQDLLRHATGGDPRRSLEDECGYPLPGQEDARLYQTLYDYEPVANRVVRLWPDECWKVQPTVYETEDADQVTVFEEAWNNLGKDLSPQKSWYGGEYASPVWGYLHRLDILSGIGHWGVLLFGLDDGMDLDQPAYGLEEQGSVPIHDPAFAQTLKDADAKGKPIYRSSFPGLSEFKPYRLSVNRAKTRNRKLTYLRVFPESLAQVLAWEGNVSSPRFGQPLYYQLSFTDYNNLGGPNSGATALGLSVSTRVVHWTRVLHTSSFLESSESVGVPEQRPVLRRLLDIAKLYGGSAEMYWKGAFFGLSLETHPNLGGDVFKASDKTGMREMMELYQNGLQRYLALSGISAKTLSPTVVDPTPQITTQIQGICIQKNVPMRIFMGSERGELASGQDSKAWDRRVYGRCTTHCTPRILIPFVDRLILYGVLPEPKEAWHGDWPEPEALTAQEKADLTVKRTQALTSYVQSGGDAVITPRTWLTREWDYTDEEADAALEEAAEHIEGEGLLSMAGQPDPDADVEVEAETVPLLERVQGIPGAASLLKARKAGEIDDDTLVQLFMLFFQLSEAEARKVVGELPKPEQPPPGSLLPGVPGAGPPKPGQPPRPGFPPGAGGGGGGPPRPPVPQPQPPIPATNRWYPAAVRPRRVRNAWCPTGSGGGHDNSCAPARTQHPSRTPAGIGSRGHEAIAEARAQQTGGTVDRTPAQIAATFAGHDEFRAQAKQRFTELKNKTLTELRSKGGKVIGSSRFDKKALDALVAEGKVRRRGAVYEVVGNAWCPTGPGGGKDNSCGGQGTNRPDVTTKRGEGLYRAERRGKVWVSESGHDFPEHVQKLGIPPAWKNVTVNPDPNGTLMAQGLDAKGRSQSRYSATHNAKQAAAKFGRVTELRARRARIFRELEADAENPALRDKAECLKLVMQTGMRPGSTGDTGADHKSYGATTLEGRHVLTKKNGEIYLRLVTGKNKGREVSFPVNDKTTQAMLRDRAAAAGSMGRLFNVSAGDLAAYSKTKGGGGFKTKDHRTALGTETALAEILARKRLPKNAKEYKRLVKDVATAVAGVLGNTPPIALKSYIDPQVFVPWRQSAGV